MSYLVLARKYRPQTFEQVVKQEHVTRTLKNAITLGRVAHAVLFSGPRGTGKTTIARILAKAMNCQEGPTPVPVPCNVCRSCKDIIEGKSADVFEIDGASNNSVEQIRELRENIKYLPAYSRYKIYIIDEVHMLSIAAFNALLKTLEEPPPHVMFIFATTEPHKIPITILSRCQRHDLRRIDLDSLCGHLEYICGEEKKEIERQSLELIAKESGGCMRDAISLLDQIAACSEKEISHEMVLDILGGVDRKVIFDLASYILASDVSGCLNIIASVYDKGQDLKKVYSDIVEHFRNLVVVKIGKNADKLVDAPIHEIRTMEEQVKNTGIKFLNDIFEFIFKEEKNVLLSTRTRMAVETVIFSLYDQIKPTLYIDELIDKLNCLKESIEKNIPLKDAETVYDNASTIREKQAGWQAADSVDNVKKDVIDPDKLWEDISANVGEKLPFLAGPFKRACLKCIDDNKIEVEAKNFAYDLINRKIKDVSDICSEVLGRKVSLTVTKSADSGDKVSDIENEKDIKAKALNSKLVSDALNIFDGKVQEVIILRRNE